MNKIIFSVIFSTFVIALTTSSVFACSCFQPEGIPIERQVNDGYINSSSVFVGQVVEVIKKPNVSSVVVRFKVEKTWNKTFQKEIKVSTEKDSSLCGFNFEVGKKYLVYASGDSNKLTTNLCTRTALAVSNKDVVILSKIKKPKLKSSLK